MKRCVLREISTTKVYIYKRKTEFKKLFCTFNYNDN